MEDFCIYGTPLEVPKTDPFERLGRKLVRPQDMPVTDTQGRRRFHGAFTGGFSAGYYNTVGSEEGWAPSTFTSSREAKTKDERALVQRPEDFMDEEDMGEFGIAPTRLVAKEKYQVDSTRQTRAVLPVKFVPDDLIVPATDGIGHRLLISMGWRPGQGVGPRMTKARLRKYYQRHKVHMDDRVLLKSRFSERLDSRSKIDSTKDSDTFAPRAALTVTYAPKRDVFGIGFKPLDGSSKSYLSDKTTLYAEGTKLPSGQAFGIGALEEEDDDDLYSNLDMSSYDHVMGASDATEKERTKHSTIQDAKYKNTISSSLCHDQRTPLDGFELAESATDIGVWFPAPTVPPSFVPRPDVIMNPDHRTVNTESLTSDQRGAILDDIPADDSIETAKKNKSVWAFVDPAERTRVMEMATSAEVHVNHQPRLPPNVRSSTRADVNNDVIHPSRSFKGINSSSATNDNPIAIDRPLSSTKGPFNGPPLGPPPIHISPADHGFIHPSRLVSGPLSSQTAALQFIHPASAQTGSSVRVDAARDVNDNVNDHKKMVLTTDLLMPDVAQAALNSSFNPFPNSVDKRERYNIFLRIHSKPAGIVRNMFVESVRAEYTKKMVGLTEWNRELEMDEFAKAAQMFKPMSTAMKSRFVSASSPAEALDRTVAPVFKEKSAQEVVRASIKRTVTEWVPDRLLCRRMGIHTLATSETKHDVPRKKGIVFREIEGVKPALQDTVTPPLQNTVAPVNCSLAERGALPVGTVADSSLVAGEQDKPIVATNTEREPVKPPKDLFTAIFGGESESEEESEVEDDDDHSNGAQNGVKNQPGGSNESENKKDRGWLFGGLSNGCSTEKVATGSSLPVVPLEAIPTRVISPDPPVLLGRLKGLDERGLATEPLPTQPSLPPPKHVFSRRGMTEKQTAPGLKVSTLPALLLDGNVGSISESSESETSDNGWTSAESEGSRSRIRLSSPLGSSRSKEEMNAKRKRRDTEKEKERERKKRRKEKREREKKRKKKDAHKQNGRKRKYDDDSSRDSRRRNKKSKR